MNAVKEVRDSIINTVTQALALAVSEGVLPAIENPDFVVEATRDSTHGDFAVNIALTMSRQAKMPPRAIAQAIVDKLPHDLHWLDKVEIAGPGFINFFLEPMRFHPVLASIFSEDESYGCSDFGSGQRVLIEFVSANPTGLLHMGNARGAALGDSLAAVMSAAGYDVSREYYINDTGNQIEKFGESLEARYLELLGEQVDFPEDGYHGEDIIDTAGHILERVGDIRDSMDEGARRAYFIKAGLEEKLSYIRSSLESFGVNYDLWFSEKSLHDDGKVAETVAILKDHGLIYQGEGALWLRATDFGGDKDEVMVKSDGAMTYFASDIAYHRDKFKRGFDILINIWGADHHGHVARLKGAMGALDYEPDALEIILMQLVRVIMDNEIVRMSKRTGQYITLDELVEEVGRDAARFFFVMRGADSQMDFDMDLAKSQSSENPVYYTQYAHARIHSLLKMAQAEDGRNADSGSPVSYTDADAGLLRHPAELTLIRKLADLPDEIARAAADREPQRIPRYVLDLAALYHSFYTECRCLVDDRPLRQARLMLSDATRIVLRNVMHIIGVSAIERM